MRLKSKHNLIIFLILNEIFKVILIQYLVVYIGIFFFKSFRKFDCDNDFFFCFMKIRTYDISH